MNVDSLLRQSPRIVPPLDPDFRPASLGPRAFAGQADRIWRAASPNWPLSKPDCLNISRFDRKILPGGAQGLGREFFLFGAFVEFRPLVARRFQNSF